VIIREKSFWYSSMAVGTAISTAGALADDDLTQQYELASGLIILMISFVAVSLLKKRARKRRRWNG
jgi:hypothetical protein